MPAFKVLHSRVGDFSQGEIVLAEQLGEHADLARLQNIGAIEPASPEDTAKAEAAVVETDEAGSTSEDETTEESAEETSEEESSDESEDKPKRTRRRH